MTWNPLRRNNLNCRPTPAPPTISKQDDVELEQLFYKLQHLEETTKKLQKEIKKYLDSVSAAGKAEQKITSELSASQMCHRNEGMRNLVENYHTVTSQVFNGVQELLNVLQATFQEPLKTFKGQFGNIDAAFSRREQLAAEWRNTSARVKKLEERDRTAGNLLKLDRERRTLENASQELASVHNVMLTEMVQFLAKKGEFLSPTLQTFIRAQLDFHGSTTRLFTQLLPDNSKTVGTPTSALIPDEEYQAIVQDKLSKIRSLSIVKRS